MATTTQMTTWLHHYAWHPRPTSSQKWSYPDQQHMLVPQSILSLQNHWSHGLLTPPERPKLTACPTTTFHQSPNQSTLITKSTIARKSSMEMMEQTYTMALHHTQQHNPKLTPDSANDYQITRPAFNGTGQYVLWPSNYTTRLTNVCTSTHHPTSQPPT